MQLPAKLLQSLEGLKGFDREAFERLHASRAQVTSIRINPSKLSDLETFPLGNDASPSQLTMHHPVPWSQYGYYLDQRPSFTFDPLFHAGAYYVQEASSMFLEQALKQIVDLNRPIRILDLSAAPGGKSTHIQSLMTTDSLLVSNEVVRSRANILKDNIIKWGCDNVVVTNNDPKDFSKLENYFDVIIVDAPCSGSGLFRREPEAIHEWSENNVTLCSQRQQRILADVVPSLKNDGVLIYSTCSYSKEEDEEIVDWLTDQLKFKSHKLNMENGWNITETEIGAGVFAYRFWPDKVKGEGFFIACLQKSEALDEGNGAINVKSKGKVGDTSKHENEIIKQWVKPKEHRFIKNENTVYAWPASMADDMSFVLSNLRVVYSGVRIGDLVRDKLIPDHALALSLILNDAVPSANLNYDQVIQYLQRKELTAEIKEKGWQLVNYNGHPLGWINALPNRINNYYPKELRILKN